ncbi:hypothetical protein JW948_02735 [bacterium]|nr:hypothetical protein [bacterium]
MKKIMMLVLPVILCMPLMVRAGDIVGSWNAAFDTQIGLQKYVYTFEKTDDGITGKAEADINGEMNESVLTDVKVDSNRVSFTETLNFQGMDLVITYEGTISENEMKLNRNVGDFAAEEVVAKRAVGEEKSGDAND